MDGVVLEVRKFQRSVKRGTQNASESPHSAESNEHYDLVYALNGSDFSVCASTKKEMNFCIRFEECAAHNKWFRDRRVDGGANKHVSVSICVNTKRGTEATTTHSSNNQAELFVYESRYYECDSTVGDPSALRVCVCGSARVWHIASHTERAAINSHWFQFISCSENFAPKQDSPDSSSSFRSLL